MTKEFSPYAIDVFKKKGIGNAPKVRRIIQLTKNLSKKPFEQLRILDLGCGEGLYSLEAGMNGAKVLGMDGRNERLDEGAKIAKELELDNVKFLVEDIRKLSKEKYGIFDTIYYLGLLYHLDNPDVFTSLETCYNMCDHMLIIDSHIALTAPEEVVYKGNKYYGLHYEEHRPTDSEQTKRKRVMHSIGNNQSFLLTRKSLYRFLVNLGFTTILECHAPFEPAKPNSRVTLVCIKTPVSDVKSYPFINEMTESELSIKLGNKRTKVIDAINHNVSLKFRAKNTLDKLLGKFGYELKKKLRDE